MPEGDRTHAKHDGSQSAAASAEPSPDAPAATGSADRDHSTDGADGADGAPAAEGGAGGLQPRKATVVGEARPSGKRRRERPRRRVVPVLLVLVLLLGGAVYLSGVGGRLSRELGLGGPDPRRQPQLVEPPSGLDLPSPAAPAEVADGVAGDLAPAAVRRAVAQLSRGKKLGKSVAVVVAGVEGRPVFSRGPGMVTPASTTKLLTVTAALESIGSNHRFTTSVRRQGRTLVLVGGGDPLLMPAPTTDVSYPVQRADLRTLARRVADDLGRAGRTGRFALRYDTSLFDGPAVSPRWRNDYIPDNVVSPITALWSDEGRVPNGYGVRVDDPARDAAGIFADHLQAAGVKVGKPQRGTARDGSPVVGKVRSAPLSAVAQHVLEVSDNEGAEVLLRHVAIAAGAPASFAAGVRSARQVLEDLGVGFPPATRWYDGSGLSRQNRLAAATLLDVLRVSLERGELSRVTAGLPVAGFTGSLSDRFDVDADPGLGRVRAKTGTLTGVSGLVGIARTHDDRAALFVAIADRIKESNTLAARARLDQITAALADCRCGR